MWVWVVRRTSGSERQVSLHTSAAIHKQSRAPHKENTTKIPQGCRPHAEMYERRQYEVIAIFSRVTSKFIFLFKRKCTLKKLIKMLKLCIVERAPMHRTNVQKHYILFPELSKVDRPSRISSAEIFCFSDSNSWPEMERNYYTKEHVFQLTVLDISIIKIKVLQQGPQR